MKFPQHCREASLLLQKLAKLANSLERDLCRLEDARGDETTTLLTRLVHDILGANRLSEDILHAHLPFIRQEEAAVGEAIKIAHDELTRRVWGVRQDLEVVTKTASGRQQRAALRVAS